MPVSVPIFCPQSNSPTQLFQLFGTITKAGMVLDTLTSSRDRIFPLAQEFAPWWTVSTRLRLTVHIGLGYPIRMPCEFSTNGVAKCTTRSLSTPLRAFTYRLRPTSPWRLPRHLRHFGLSPRHPFHPLHTWSPERPDLTRSLPAATRCLHFSTSLVPSPQAWGSKTPPN